MMVASTPPLNLQQRLKDLIEAAHQSWTYAIFWQSSLLHFSPPVSTLLGWGDGYYHGGKGRNMSDYSLAYIAEQEQRKKVLRELNTLISGQQAPSHDSRFDEDVTDSEWFFLISMTQSFENGSGLPGQALAGSIPIWVVGGEKMVDSNCERARQARTLGLQTMVFLPSVSGVVDLGSTGLIYQNDHLMKKARALFNFGNGNNSGLEPCHGSRSGSGSWPDNEGMLSFTSSSGRVIADLYDSDHEESVGSN